MLISDRPVRNQTQPYCRCCGKPIPKVTTTIYFGRNPDLDPLEGFFSAKPKTKADVQKFTNGEVISARTATICGETYVHWANVWDRETYKDGQFCTVSCAAAFGRMAAKEHPELETLAAYDARRKREKEA